MARIKLQKIDSHLKEQLKNKEFRKCFELERAKVALAQRIAEIREEKGLKQVDLAKKLKVSQQFISQIETGREKNLTIETLLKIAKSLGRNVRISFPKSSGPDSYTNIA